MMRCFSQSSQGSQPSQHEPSTALQPSNDPSSPRSGASIEHLVELPVSCPVPTKCMGVLPFGVSSALVLRGCYPLMRHAHEKVHWFYVDGVGCFSRDPPCTREARVDESGNPLPGGAKFGRGEKLFGQISKASLVPNISFNFKDSLCPPACTVPAPAPGREGNIEMRRGVD